MAGCAPQAKAETSGDATKADAAETKADVSAQTDWLGSAPDIAAGDIKETKQADLLIIGAGNGGMAAAATAADLGLDFMLCEKSSSVQRSRHWFGAINTKHTEAVGAHMDEGRLLNEFSRYASSQCDERVIRVWIKEGVSVVDWIDPILTQAGMTCDFDNDIDHKTGGTSFALFPMEHYYSGTAAAGEALERNKVLLSYINDKATTSPTTTNW